MATIFLTHTPTSRDLYYGERALAGLRALGSVVLHEGDRPLDAQGLITAASGAQIIVADRATAGPAEVFASLPDLVAFVRVAVDIRNVDLEAASNAGVLVTRASPGFVESVVELTIGFLVDLSRDITRAVQSYRAGLVPTIRMGRQLAGGTLGIVGFGEIGRRLATVGQALGMTILVSDPYVAAGDSKIQQVPFPELLARSDFVVCLAAAAAETESLFSESAFRSMKSDAFFLNLARGELVDDDALDAALREGWIAGAALDVGRAPDQMPALALARLPNVIATPHIGGLTASAVEHQALETVHQIACILGGRHPDGTMNPAAWTRRVLVSATSAAPAD